jgi:predicted TIM-barrel fold metal-dependent hydrolase
MEMPGDMLIVDFDNHYIETKDAFTRYIAEEYAVQTVTFENGPRNQNYVLINGKRCVLMPNYNPPLDSDAGTVDFFEALKAGKLEASAPESADAPMLPEIHSSMPRAWCERAPRLELMDRQGLHATIMLPSVGVSVELELAREGDVDLAHAVYRAFNRWLEDQWGYDYKGRIFAIPQIRLYDLDQAMDELERLIAAGARGVNLPLGPVWDADGKRHSPASTRYDRFWSRVVEADLFVTLHLSLTEYHGQVGDMWGDEARSPSGALHEMPGFAMWAAGDRPILETVGGMLLFNLFGRHPGLKVASVENGGGAWLEYLMNSINKGMYAPPYAPWPGGKPTEMPTVTVRKHLHVAPYPEDSIPRVVQLLGEDNVMFGSDYPHPEGLPSPMHMMKRLQGLTDEQVRKVMGLNAAKMLKIGELDQRRLLGVTTPRTVEEAMLARAS